MSENAGKTGLNLPDDGTVRVVFYDGPPTYAWFVEPKLHEHRLSGEEGGDIVWGNEDWLAAPGFAPGRLEQQESRIHRRVRVNAIKYLDVKPVQGELVTLDLREESLARINAMIDEYERRPWWVKLYWRTRNRLIRLFNRIGRR